MGAIDKVDRPLEVLFSAPTRSRVGDKAPAMSLIVTGTELVLNGPRSAASEWTTKTKRKRSVPMKSNELPASKGAAGGEVRSQPWVPLRVVRANCMKAQ